MEKMLSKIVCMSKSAVVSFRYIVVITCLFLLADQNY